MVSDLVAAIDTSARMLTAHERIVEAIERRDGDGAALWAHRHIEDFRRGLDKAGLDFDRPVTFGGGAA
jgi:GntR family transcriptional repressor for pyruvate dehydrogenase complex